MIAVIFEVEPADGRESAYLTTATDLRPLLDGIEGFISVERFRSLPNPGKILSLSFFESEEAVTCWRNLPQHRRAQPWDAAVSLRDTACASHTSCVTMACWNARNRRMTARN